MAGWAGMSLSDGSIFILGNRVGDWFRHIEACLWLTLWHLYEQQSR